MTRKPDFVDECYAGKDLSLLKKLTLVIPTYNRNYYLSRCLWYHAHFPFGEIIVADSSPEEKKVVNRETVAKVREMFGANIIYLEYEPESDKYGGDIYRKWYDAILHVKSNFSQFCTDKEFMVPTAQLMSLDFLQKEDGYVSAEGCVYKVQKNTQKGLEYFTWQNVPSVINDNPVERLNTAVTRTTGTLFSIYRSDDHKQIYQNLIDYNINDIRYGETAIELQPLCMGKIKKWGDVPGRVRDVIASKSSSPILSKINKSESSFTRYPMFNEYPKSIANRLNLNLQKCLSSRLKTNDTDLDMLLNIILYTRYLPKSGIFVYDKIKYIQKLCNIMPTQFLKIIKCFVGRKETFYSHYEIGLEISVIDKCIIQNISNHDTDSPINIL